MVQQRTIGIDLAIAGAQVAQVYDDGEPQGRPIRFRLHSAELERFVRQVHEGTDERTEIIAVMEPTGMAWFPVASWLVRSGVSVWRVKGQRVKALRRYLSEHVKSDNLDARVLGLIPRFGGRRADPVHVPERAHHALQRLTRQRSRYMDQICNTRRRVLDLIRWSCPALEPVMPDPTSALGLMMLENYFDPELVIRTRRDVLRRFVDRHASGPQRSAECFAAKLVEELKEAARETCLLHPEASVSFADVALEIRQELALVRLWQQQIAELERRIADIATMLEPDSPLESIPGIGPRIVPLLLGIIADVNRFPSARRLRGYCGLVPTYSESGGLERAGQQLTKSGNNRLKRSLFLAADTARKIDPDMARTYHHLMVNRGHHHKQALCAVANRLINRVHAVMKSGKGYVLRDLDGAEIDVAGAREIVKSRFTVPIEIRRARSKHRREAVIGT